MNRFGAFLVHLGISLVIFAVLAAVVVFVWYPDFFFTTDGGWQGIRIIAMVDLVLGPVLTLIVFNRAKPRAELTRDLTIIGLLQAVCLAAGVYVVYAERPLALVYVDGKFHSVSADSFTEAGLEVPDLSEHPGPYPKRVAVVLPDDLVAQSEIRAEAYRRRVPLNVRADLYVPWDPAHISPAEQSFTMDQLKALDAGAGDLEHWLARRDDAARGYVFYPYGARYGFMFLALSTEDRKIAGVVEVPYFGHAPQ